MQSNDIRKPFRALRDDLSELLIGRESLIERLLIALLTRGHVLIEGAPGLAKTRAVKLFATGITALYSRIQFTPDLLPADLTGTQIYVPQSGRFDFRPGPLFANIVLIDEVNRAPPKVQSALLEVMAERQITVAGETRVLDEPFMVVATQNSIEHEGTYPLPEAQLDRFLFSVELPMPDLTEEKRILELALNEVSGESPGLSRQVSQADLESAWASLAEVYVSPAILQYVAEITVASRRYNATRGADLIEYPASPRASIGMAGAARAKAWLAGRDHVLPADIAELAPDVLRARIGLSYRARAEGVAVNDVIREIIDATPPV